MQDSSNFEIQRAPDLFESGMLLPEFVPPSLEFLKTPRRKVLWFAWRLGVLA
jgi:hypothetical protein